MGPSHLWYQAQVSRAASNVAQVLTISQSTAYSLGLERRSGRAPLHGNSTPGQQLATAAHMTWMLVRPAMASLASEWQQPFSGQAMLHHKHSQTEPASTMTACCISSHHLHTMPATSAALRMLQAFKATRGPHPPCCSHLPVPAVGVKAVLVHKLWVCTCAHHQPPQGVLHGG